MDGKSAEMQLLIKKITSQVVNDFINGQLHNTDLRDENVSGRKVILVLLPEFITGLPEFFEYLVDKHPGCRIVAASFNDVNVSNNTYINEIVNISRDDARKRLFSKVNDFYTVYYMMPGIKRLEAIVDGDDAEFFEKILIYRVLHGKHVGILLDYNLKDLPSNNFTKKLGKLFVELKEMKIPVETIGNRVETIVSYKSKVDKCLITEEYVNELHSKGMDTIQNGSECIFTPLARDRINELGFKILNN